MADRLRGARDTTDYDGLVTSRKPDDPPAFCDRLVEEICEGVREQQAQQTAGADASG